MAANIRNKRSVGTAAGVGTSYTSIELTAVDAYTGSVALQSQAYLDKLLLSFNTIATAASFSWYLSWDEAGEYPITDPLEALSFKDGKTSGTKVRAANLFGASYTDLQEGANHYKSIYLQIKGDAGTFTVEAILLWRGR